MQKQTKSIESRYSRYIKSFLLKTRNNLLSNINNINSLIDNEKSLIRDSYLTEIFNITDDTRDLTINNKELDNIYNDINKNNIKFEEQNTKEKFPILTAIILNQKNLFIESNKKYIKEINDDFIKSIENDFIAIIKNEPTEEEATNTNIKSSIEDKYSKAKTKSEFVSENEILTASAILSKYRLQDILGSDIYIWRTQGDKKVRSSHNPLNGKYCKWSDPTVYANTLEDVINNNWIDKTSNMVNLHPGFDYRCYEKNTEVYTKDGFKLIRNVNIGEEILTLNPLSKNLEWSNCISKIEKFSKKILKLKSNIFSLNCSLDHTFFYYKKKFKGKKQITNSHYPVFSNGFESLSNKNTSFYSSSEWIGRNTDYIFGIPIDIYCKFIGYYLSDGSLDKREHGEQVGCIKISQQDNNDLMYNEFKDYLHICKGKSALYIYNNNLYNHCKQFGYCYQKFIPNEIKCLNKNYIRIFLNAFALCDGRLTKTTKSKFDNRILKSYNQYYTTSKKMADDLVECIIKSGMSASQYLEKKAGKKQEFKNGIYTINYDLYTINELKTNYKNLSSMEKSIENYNDMVYDIEVEKNHTLLIKTGKDIHWNSNCRCWAEYINLNK